MQPLDLNMASRPFKNDTLPWVGLVTAVVVLIAVTVWNIRTYKTNAVWAEDLKQQWAADREEMGQFDQRERGAQRDIEGFDLETLYLRADKANEVIRWKAFSWTQLFNLLQEVLPNDVQMVSIRPVFRPQGPQRDASNPEEGRVPVSVEGIAKTLGAFFEFERELLAHPHFDRVDPEGHTQDRTGSVAFQLKFLYDPSPPVEPAEVTDQAAVLDAEAQAGADEPADVSEPGAETPPGSGEEQAGPLPTVDPAGDAPPAQDLASPQAEGSGSTTPAAEGVEATTDAAAEPEKPGRRKKGKRRGGIGRGTEGDR